MAVAGRHRRQRVRRPRAQRPVLAARRLLAEIGVRAAEGAEIEPAIDGLPPGEYRRAVDWFRARDTEALAETITWGWIGTHAEYDRLVSS